MAWRWNEYFVKNQNTFNTRVDTPLKKTLPVFSMIQIRNFLFLECSWCTKKPAFYPKRLSSFLETSFYCETLKCSWSDKCCRFHLKTLERKLFSVIPDKFGKKEVNCGMNRSVRSGGEDSSYWCRIFCGSIFGDWGRSLTFCWVHFLLTADRGRPSD